MFHYLTPIMLNGYVQWVHPWRADGADSAYLFGEEFATPYCPVIFEVRHDAI